MHDGHLEETLRRILARALATEVKDPRVGFVTVSEVRLNKDNTVATVFFTVMGDEQDIGRTLAGLGRARGFLRQQINQQLRLRVLPELRFKYDDSLDRSFRLEEILDDLEVPPDDPSEGPSDGPSGGGVS